MSQFLTLSHLSGAHIKLLILPNINTRPVPSMLRFSTTGLRLRLRSMSTLSAIVTTSGFHGSPLCSISLVRAPHYL